MKEDLSSLDTRAEVNDLRPCPGSRFGGAAATFRERRVQEGWGAPGEKETRARVRRGPSSRGGRGPVAVRSKVASAVTLLP